MAAANDQAGLLLRCQLQGLVIVEAPQGSEVEEVDFGDNVGTVFEVEGEAGEPIAVVWIMDDEMEQAIQ